MEQISNLWKIEHENALEKDDISRVNCQLIFIVPTENKLLVVLQMCEYELSYDF